ncbi:MAG TPA: hypothetical protein VK752_04690 [Bryobacteraceae bacterium]|jgi:hypothetical protein|nr:hypothetical protein [Bryobacteraceae bacterium]
MRWSSLIAIAALPLIAKGQSLRFVDQSPMAFGAQPHYTRMVVWKGDTLSFVPEHGAAPNIRWMNRRGEEETPVAFALPGSADIWLEDAARGSDGITAVVGSASYAGGQEGGFLSVISAGRQSTIQLQPYRPYRVVFASNGSIWTLGSDDTNDKGALIRQFDRNGKLISSHLPGSTVSKLPDFSVGDIPASLFATAQGRVGWYAPQARRYFELSSDGALTQYEGVPNHQAGALALTDAGATIVSSGSIDGHWELWSLDREKRVWSKLDLSEYGPSGYSPLLYGASGNTIAVTVKVGDISFFEVQ